MSKYFFMKSSLFFESNFPFAPSRVPFFYGWVILIFTTLGTVASIPGQTMGVGVFTDYLIHNTSLDRMEISVSYMIGTILSSILILISGSLVDRFGTRVMTSVAGIGLGVSLILFSQSLVLISYLESILPEYSSSLISIMVMTLIFLCLRQFGQGLLAMVSRITLAKWFDRRRGLVSGISGIFVAFGFSGAPLFMNQIIGEYGYSKSIIIMSIIFGFGMALLGWLFYRDNPEECGLLMDGGKNFNTKKFLVKAEPEISLSDALKTYNFWIFCLGICSGSLILTGFTFHISSIGSLAGLSRDDSNSFFLPIAFISMISHLISGWASDRMPLKYILMVMLFSLSLGCLGILNLELTLFKLLVIIGFGVQGGIWLCLMTVTWPRFYGRKHLGSISGVVMGAQIFFSAIGPPIFGLSESLRGNYNIAALMLSITNIILLFGSLFAKSHYKG